MFDQTLANKVIIVTGASRGIGRSVTEELAKNGARVYANVRNETSELACWAEEYGRKYQGQIVLCYFDLMDIQKVKTEIMKIWKENGRIDVLVNNAGVEFNENIGMILPEHMLQMFQVNVFALIEMTQLVSRLMMRKRNGSIINMASVVGRYGSAGQSVYAATKGAVIAFSKSAAKELGRYNIRVNAIAPGLTCTNMIEETDVEKLNKRIEQIPLNRIACPEDIAKVCAFLASDSASYISGQVLGIDGGTTL